MAGFQKIDKKQVPQVVGLGVIAAGMFGYFAYRMTAPTAAAAPTVKAAAASPAGAATPAGATAAGAGGAAGKADATAPADAPPPSPGMRDPFATAAIVRAAPAPAPVESPARVAAAPTTGGGAGLHVPFAPALPPGGGTALSLPGAAPGRLAPMPVAPAAAPVPSVVAPTWTVTGVLQSGASNVAILRDGSARRFARQGEVVGGDFRVVDVTRQFVVLQHGSRHYVLPLGGPRTAAAPPSAPPAPSLPTLSQGAAPAAPPLAAGALPGVPPGAALDVLQQLAGKL